VGEVLFWTLEKVLGPIRFDVELLHTWQKIFSRLLRSLVPLALAHELRNGINQEQRLAKADDSIQRKIDEKKGRNSMSTMTSTTESGAAKAAADEA